MPNEVRGRLIDPAYALWSSQAPYGIRQVQDRFRKPVTAL